MQLVKSITSKLRQTKILLQLVMESSMIKLKFEDITP